MKIEIPEKNWLEELLIHNKRMQYRYPAEKRVVLLNADTTILDIRHVIPFLLKSFDPRTRGYYYSYLQAAPDGAFDESVMVCKDLPPTFDNKEETLIWYLNDRQRAEAVIASAKYYTRLMELIRHFEFEADAYVGFLSQRGASLRNRAWHVIQAICREYRIDLKESLLFMAPERFRGHPDAHFSLWQSDFEEIGFRVVATIDCKLYRDMRLEEEASVFSISKDTLFNFYAGGNAYARTPV